MTNLPLQSIFVSDFRRLEGRRTLPLDAPIVLLHGPNGTGKTSVLSALELALTGEIRSMARHDPRYFAHLPFHGKDFAALRVEVADDWAANDDRVVMTVGGSVLEGSPALSREAAQFYAERCFLDQVSLGQLLELYQYREGDEESALARFVNELLGLEQLDALRVGLHDANDWRRLKNLAASLSDAENAAQRAGADLLQARRELEATRATLAQTRSRLADALQALGLELHEPDDAAGDSSLAERVRSRQPQRDESVLEQMITSLTALGGRIQSLSARPSAKRLEEAQVALNAARAASASWLTEHGPAIEAWRAASANLDVRATEGQIEVIDAELDRIDRLVTRHHELVASTGPLVEQAEDLRSALMNAEEQLAQANEHAGSLVEGLAALRDHALENVCPVCNRDFGEVSTTHLTAHIEGRIAELTAQGLQLRELRARRDEFALEVQRSGQALELTRRQLMPPEQLEASQSRRTALASLRDAYGRIAPAIRLGLELQARVTAAEEEIADLEAIASETDQVLSQLAEIANRLDVAPPGPEERMQAARLRIADVASQRLARAQEVGRAYALANQLVSEYVAAKERVRGLRDIVAEAAERKLAWEERVKEAKRRQGVARSVFNAASEARTAIVQRVFTQSLNDVWQSVFARLAPREPFVPAFGLPTTSKAGMKLSLETIHKSGETGGSPQMMLSAGNLNTAALSLFIALHLAVDPVVPCLVFDDPVQSMDEVHIAQFAGLMRVLAKHHGRQIVIAVHERALFEYLALELSPAFEGDELITIELGPRSEDVDQGVSRRTWSPDPALAG